MANTNIGISNFVYSQSPFFVRNDHPNFIKFVEAYYQYLEQEGKTIERAKGFRSALDIDRTIDLYADKLYSQFLSLLPDNVIADKNLILKHVKDFYRSRGTEKSIEFLMSILYDLDTNFYYPKRDILKASDGKWFKEKSLKVFDVQLNNVADNNIYTAKKFTEREIRGQTSNASATVENVDVYYENGALIKELKISSQTRDFIAGEKIFATYEEEGNFNYISANVFSGIIASVNILNSGNSYILGTQVPIESNTGSGGVVIISSISVGSLKLISVTDGGAGFQNSNIILVTGGGGSGANADVSSVNTDETYHPNSYNVVIATISLEAGTRIGNSRYSNLNSSITDPANNWIANSMLYFTYSNTGPIQSVTVLVGGNNYSTGVNLTGQANTRIKNLGILGRMRIIDGGQDYAVNDEIEFINQPYLLAGAGFGARGYVESVNATTGAITSVKFKQVPGHYIGGSGYSMFALPLANVISGTGNGANVIVTATLGEGEILSSVSDDVGAIRRLTIVSGGSGYVSSPTLNLKALGSGTAQAVATIVQGVYTYPGRYLNDDGHLSSFNFLQDGKYYHNYSYVVRIKQAINSYRKALKDLVHPAGMIAFGEYTMVDEGETMNVDVSTTSNVKKTIFNYAVYGANSGNIRITRTSHGLVNGNTVYLEFQSGNTINIMNGIFTVMTSNANTFFILQSNTVNTSGNVYYGTLQ